ncbi:N-acetyllactosaminide beta-1,3-N-acetylglucosaminyltransferase 4-like [Liolophura sinensis]|uniref:N-acetyllactosaminide beta-1,3-N-acetylglucosaminyltransferase 4-like n=1 Tax=Liolophura sinensis TaxID=3198878 RepID=UPI0031591EB6
MDGESTFRRRKAPEKSSLVYLASCCIVLACWFLLVFWSPRTPIKTFLKLHDTRVAAHIKDVVEHADGSVDVVLHLDETNVDVRALRENMSMERSSAEHRRTLATLPSTQSRSMRPIITKTHYPLTLTSPYVINNPDICTGAADLTFLIMVHSAPNHFGRRRSLRETWANKNIFKDIKMRIVFLFGLASDRKTQVFIENESTVYKDIVQGNFKDTYRNLTHKGVLGYRWISENCNSSKLIIKVDDDVFVNIFNVIDYYLPKYGKKPKQILCHVRKEGTSPILHGNTKLKWAVGEDDFRGHKFYPTYCNGYAVFMTPDLITGMYRAAYLTPFFWVDDVYLFGLLPKKIGGVTWESVVSNFTLNQKIGLESYESKGPTRFVVCSAWADGVMERLWFAALSRMTDSNRKLINDDLIMAVDEMVRQKSAKEASEKLAAAAVASVDKKVDASKRKGEPVAAVKQAPPQPALAKKPNLEGANNKGAVVARVDKS